MTETGGRMNWRHGAAIVLAAIAAWVIHFTAPADQLDDDQLKPWGYVADIVLHGRWMVQTDYEGAFMSKPPLYQWLCAALAHTGLGVGPWAMYLPTGLAIIGSALLVWRLGTRWFGERVGLAAGLAFVLSPLTIKHLCLARTDALFCFTVTLAACAAWRVWKGGGGWWLWFWLAATLASLTKGPLGVLLAAGGLGAVVWEWWGGGRQRASCERGRVGVRPWVWFFVGAAVWLALVGGWFWLAVREGGQGVIDRMIGRELIGHATQHESTGRGLFSGWYKPPLYFLSRYVPWGVVTVFAMVRVVARPSTSETERRAERFLFCWIAVGMVVFCAAPHQRADLLLPLIPAAAVLAGRELVRWGSALRGGRVRWFWPTAAAVMLGQAWAWHHLGRPRDGEVVQTRAAVEISERLRQLLRDGPGRVEFAASAWDVQWLWGVKAPGLDAAAVRAALAGPQRVYVVAREGQEIEGAGVARAAAGDGAFVIFAGGE